MQLHRGEKLKLVTVYIVQSAGCGLRTTNTVCSFSLSISLSRSNRNFKCLCTTPSFECVKGTIKMFKCYDHQACSEFEIEKKILMGWFAPQIPRIMKFFFNRNFFSSVLNSMHYIFINFNSMNEVPNGATISIYMLKLMHYANPHDKEMILDWWWSIICCHINERFRIFNIEHVFLVHFYFEIM